MPSAPFGSGSLTCASGVHRSRRRVTSCRLADLGRMQIDAVEVIAVSSVEIANRVLSMSRFRSPASIVNSCPISPTARSGKSSAESVWRLKREWPDVIVRRSLSPSRFISTSAPSGSLRTMSCRTCAGMVSVPGAETLALMLSLTSRSRSVALNISVSPEAFSMTFDKIGMVVRRSTTLVTWLSAFKSSPRSISRRMSVLNS